MAKRVGLSIYGLSLYNSERKININLNNVYMSKSIIELIKDYIDINGKTYSNDINNERLYKFDNVKLEDVNVNGKQEYTILVGTVKTGEYGIQSELVDITDNSTTEKKSTQADILPFGFCIALAKGNKSKAVVILQTLGNLGIKSVFTRYISKCLESNKIRESAAWGSLYPVQYIKRIMNIGKLEKIRLIQYEIPEETVNRIGANSGVKLREERVIIKPTGFIKNKREAILECLNGQRASTSRIELPDFTYDQLKLEFSINKKTKTIDFNDTTELKVNEDITDQISIINGIPNFNSLKNQMKITAYEYLKLIGFIV